MFREEFASLSAFKFFTEETISGIESTICKNNEMFHDIQSTLAVHGAKMNEYEKVNYDLDTMLSTIDKKLKELRFKVKKDI